MLLTQCRLKLPYTSRSAPPSFFLLIGVQKYSAICREISVPVSDGVGNNASGYWPQGFSLSQELNIGIAPGLLPVAPSSSVLTAHAPWPTTVDYQNYLTFDPYQAVPLTQEPDAVLGSELQQHAPYIAESTTDANWATTTIDQTYNVLDPNNVNPFPAGSFSSIELGLTSGNLSTTPVSSSNGGSHACPYEQCHKSYGRNGDLSRHIKNKHQQPSLFLCHFRRCPRGIPGMGFARKDKLVDHLKSKKHGLSANDAAYEATLQNASRH